MSQPHCGGPAPLLDAAARAMLMACVARQPDAMLEDATLKELRGHLAAAGASAAGRTTFW